MTLTYVIVAIFIILSFTSTLLADQINDDVKRSLGYNVEAFMDFPGMVKKYHYNSETHEVITKDGYILTLFRISNPKCKKYHQRPVLLMHGLLLSAECFVDSGPKSGLAYLIADACFDLWVGNQRGTFHGRRHVELNPDSKGKFWEFTYHEMAIYDQPAIVDYILKITKADILNYIGFSEGGATFNIMCSLLPEYNRKFGVSIQLAPSSRMLHTRAPGFMALNKGAASLERSSLSNGTEVLGRQSTLTNLFEFICNGMYPNLEFCKLVMDLVDDYHEGSVTGKTYQIFSGHFPSGTSQRNLAHFGQALESDKFRAYDYGRVKNMLLYGEVEPPEYNLTLVTAPVVTLAGQSDRVVDLKDVKWLSGKLTNLLEFYVVKDKDWNHFDTAYSRYVPRLIFPKILQYLLQYS